jgi:heptaprenyl diphosphate synthase
MMPSVIENSNTPENISLLIATASILQISEALIPYPIPGLRFGFANIVSLIILIQYGFKPALIVTLLRTIVSSFIMGSFLSPGFILSFFGGLTGICVAGILHQIFNRVSNRALFFRISPVGLGMAGAFAHNMVQVNLAYLMIIRLEQIFFLIPWLAFGALIFGAFSGSMATGIINELILKKNDVTNIGTMGFQSGAGNINIIYKQGDSLVHKCMPEIKFAIVLGLTILLVLKENLILYALVFVGILMIIAASGLTYKETFKILKRIWVVILSSFALPLYFNPGSQVFIETGFVSLHKEAVVAGSVFAARIILLALISSILAQTTKTHDFTKGIRTFIKPFDRIGMDSSYIASTISLSLLSLPRVWNEIRSLIRFLIKGKKRNINTLKQVVLQLFVYIFSASGSRH